PVMANLLSGACTCAEYWRGERPRPKCVIHGGAVTVPEPRAVPAHCSPRLIAESPPASVLARSRGHCDLSPASQPRNRRRLPLAVLPVLRAVDHSAGYARDAE